MSSTFRGGIIGFSREHLSCFFLQSDLTKNSVSRGKLPRAKGRAARPQSLIVPLTRGGSQTRQSMIRARFPTCERALLPISHAAGRPKFKKGAKWAERPRSSVLEIHLEGKVSRRPEALPAGAKRSAGGNPKVAALPGAAPGHARPPARSSGASSF